MTHMETHTCATCIHWLKQPQRTEAVIPPTVGECRARPPVVSYSWPRTHASDHCACYLASRPTGAAPRPAAKNPPKASLLTL